MNCSILLQEVPPDDRPAAARTAGAEAVEFWWPFDRPVPPPGEVDAFCAAIVHAGVQLVSLNLFGGDLASGDRGILSWPDAGDVFEENAAVALRILDATGCGVVNALYGRRRDGLDIRTQDEVALERLGRLADAVAEAGAIVVLEPLSGFPDYPLRRAADVLEVADAVGSPHIGLLADLYHLALNGDDVDDVIRRHGDRIGHVQIADAPGRVEPGRGTLPLEQYLTTLATTGYEGWCGLEYLPAPGVASPFTWWSTRRERS